MHDAVAAVSILKTERDKWKRKADYYECLLEQIDDMYDGLQDMRDGRLEGILLEFQQKKLGLIK